MGRPRTNPFDSPDAQLWVILCASRGYSVTSISKSIGSNRAALKRARAANSDFDRRLEDAIAEGKAYKKTHGKPQLSVMPPFGADLPAVKGPTPETPFPNTPTPEFVAEHEEKLARSRRLEAEGERRAQAGAPAGRERLSLAELRAQLEEREREAALAAEIEAASSELVETQPSSAAAKSIKDSAGGGFMAMKAVEAQRLLAEKLETRQLAGAPGLTAEDFEDPETANLMLALTAVVERFDGLHLSAKYPALSWYSHIGKMWEIVHDRGEDARVRVKAIDTINAFLTQRDMMANPGAYAQAASIARAGGGSSAGPVIEVTEPDDQIVIVVPPGGRWAPGAGPDGAADEVLSPEQLSQVQDQVELAREPYPTQETTT